MKSNLRQTLRTTRGLQLSQSLREAINLLHFNTFELKMHVAAALQANPLLECPDDADPADYYDEPVLPGTVSASVSMPRRDHDDSDFLENVSVEKSLKMHLLEQILLCRFSETEQIIAEALVDAIDERGYLVQTFDEMIDSLRVPVSCEQVESVLLMIQGMDPPGVGARNLKECLLLQLDHLSEVNASSQGRVGFQLARDIISDHLDTLLNSSRKNNICLDGVSRQELENALQIVRQLDFSPGLKYGSLDPGLLNEPELYLTRTKNNRWKVILRQSLLTDIRVNSQYEKLIIDNKKDCEFRSIRLELDSARMLVNGLKRRNDTLLRVAQYIVDWQSDYFSEGAISMKPLRLADVASALDLHESSISRVTNGKFISTPRGIHELKFFFTGNVGDSSGDKKRTSAIAVRDRIRQIIEQGELSGKHRMSDDAISRVLQEEGVSVARRTVAKYRHAIGIESVYQRNRPSVENAFKLFDDPPKRRE